MTTASLMETMMVLLFEVSWPTSIVRSWRSRSTKEKSLMFSIYIFAGYICGVTSKLLKHDYNLAFVFYVINLTMVGIVICLWFRNRRLETRA